MTQTKTSADRGSTPLESTNLEKKMTFKDSCETCGCDPCDCDWGHYAGVAQLVEHHVANVNVVGSSPITRSIIIQ